MTSPRPSLSSQFPSLPQGRTIGSYSTYEEARHAIDVLLANEGFSAQSISVVGSDLSSVERVTGRMSTGRAALSGLMSGVMIGLFVSLMWMIVNPISNLLTLAGIFLLAVAFGMIWALIVYAMTPNKREFTSVMQLTAGRFDIIVPNELAGQAVSILQQAGHGHNVHPHWQAPRASTPQPPTQQPAESATPPKTYGEMQDELRRQKEQQRSDDEGFTVS